MSVDALELGATLYLPATRPDLSATLWGGRVPGLRSAVLCLEDAIAPADVPLGLARLAALLRTIPPAGTRPALFVRPRDPAMFQRILRLPGADRLAGFVLPKIDADTLPLYLDIADLTPGQRLMPTLESRETFDPVATRRLRRRLEREHARILAIRIGGNDLLQAIGARRARSRTAYEGPLGPLIARLVGEFAPWGFALSAPVMERFDDPLLLREEVLRDIEHGLLTKTAIHPLQVPVIQHALAVPRDDLDEARRILAGNAPAVFAARGAMCEPATHGRWATLTERRAVLFGIAEPLAVARHA